MPEPPDRRAREREAEIARGCRLNPLWVEGVWDCDRSLEIAVPGLRLEDSLREYARSVEVVALETLHPERNGGKTLPFDADAFDLVTLYGAVPTRRMLEEIKRCLRPGGALLIGVANRWYYRGLLGARRSEPAPSRRDSTRGRGGGAGLGRRLRRAGFDPVREYLAAPSLAEPWDLVPCQGPGLQRVTSQRVREGEETGLRRWIAHCTPTALFPARILLARLGQL